MSKIRTEIGRVFNQPIPKGKWFEVFNEAFKNNRIDIGKLSEMIIIICMKLEEFEDKEDEHGQPTA